MPRTSRPIFKISCSTIRVNRRETNNPHGRGAPAPPPRSGLISDETHSTTFFSVLAAESDERKEMLKLGVSSSTPSEPPRNTKNQGPAIYFFGDLTSFDACTSTNSGGARSHASPLASLLLFSVYIFPLSVYIPPGMHLVQRKMRFTFFK